MFLADLFEETNSRRYILRRIFSGVLESCQTSKVELLGK